MAPVPFRIRARMEVEGMAGIDEGRREGCREEGKVRT